MIAHVAGATIACVANIVAARRVDAEGTKAPCMLPLLDIVHRAAPLSWTQYEGVVDIFPILAGVAVAATAATTQQIDVARLLRDVAVMFTLRAVTTSVTVLPSPICQGGRSSRAVGGCNSCIFSGHTVLTLLFAHTLAKAEPHLRPWLLVYCLVASIVIVATRAHYTVDVVVAWIAAAAIVKGEF